jgi:Gluconate 2-dehydrogenase subunit 3
MGAYALAIVRAALADAEGPPPQEVEAEAYAFVERQLARLPDVLKIPVRAAGRAIDAIALRTYHKQFTSLSLPQQRYVLAAGRSSKTAAVRDAIKFYEALAIFVEADMAKP